MTRHVGLPEGELADEDKLRAEEAFEDAATPIAVEAPRNVAARWKLDAPKVAVLVVAKVAHREFDNPRGVDRETLGEHTIGRSDTSGVYLAACEVGQIRRAAIGRSRGFVGHLRTPNNYPTV